MESDENSLDAFLNKDHESIIAERQAKIDAEMDEQMDDVDDVDDDEIVDYAKKKTNRKAKTIAKSSSKQTASTSKNAASISKATTKSHENRRIASVWTDPEVTKLIEQVEMQPSIWNFACEDNRNRGTRDQAWTLIAAAFDNKKETSQLRVKWQLLSNQHRDLIAKASKTKSGQGAETLPHWKFYSQMAFLRNIKKQTTVVTESNLVSRPESAASNVSVGEFTDESTSQSFSSGVAPRKRKMKTVASEESATEKETEEILLSGIKCAIDQLQKPTAVIDDVQSFGNYLTAELRKIRNIVYREQTQRKLLQLLWQCKDKEPVF